ncbi:MAG: LptF/LptG family permease [Proteobacteria bacterium]|nr:LptF/LptG family permease [Pseudomonadota bacterium]
MPGLTLIDKYLFKISFKSLLSLSSIVITIVWLAQSMRYLEIIVNNDSGFFSYISLVLFLIPELLSVALPICLLISGMHFFQHLIATHEVTILRSSGFSNFQVARPFLMLCLFATCFSTFVSTCLTPFALQRFNSYRHFIQTDMTNSVIHPGAFNRLNQAIIYVKEVSKKGSMKGLFVSVDPKVDSNGFVLMASTGYLKKNEGRLKLILSEGHRQEIDNRTQKISSAYFESFTYDLTDLVKQNKERQIRPYERSTLELLKANFVKDDLTLKKRVQAEAHKRILMPWLNFLFGVIITATILYGDIQRRRRHIKVIIGSVICVATYIIFLGLIESIQTGLLSILWLYIFLFIGIICSLYILKIQNIKCIDKIMKCVKGFNLKDVTTTKT